MLATLALFLSVQGGLIVNSGFTDGWNGWAPIWSREPGKATAEIVEGTIGRKAVKIVSSGSQDWSFAQADTIAVKPGQILNLTLRIRSENLQSAEAGFVTRNGKGEVMDWSYGASAFSGTQGWIGQPTRRIVIPEGCASIQFRLIGNGPGTVWMQDPQLTDAGTIEERRKNLKDVTIQWGSSHLTLGKRGELKIEDTKMNHRWQTAPLGNDLLLLDSVVGPESVRAAGVGHGSAIRFKLWDVVNDLELSGTITIKGGFDFVLTGHGHQARDIAFPAPFVTAKGQWLVVPMNEGILFPVDDKSIDPMRLVAYGGHGISMPWVGLLEPKSGAGLMVIHDTPDDASIDINRFGAENLGVRSLFEPSRGKFVHRRFRFLPIDKGGYVAMAKTYRRSSSSKRLTLDVKRRRNPNVDRLIGAINVWNWDMPKLPLCEEMKRMGMDRVLWSSGGSKEEIEGISKLGYLPGRYDIFQDVWDPKTSLSWQLTEGWPEDLVHLPNGDWMRGWTHPEKQPDGTTKWYQGGVICSTAGLRRAKKTVPEDLAKIPYLARFIDTTTASPWRECYNPAHPLTRSDDRQNKMDLLRFMSHDMKQVTGTETGIDPSVPYVHYYEGMLSLGPYRLPDSGTDMMAYRKPTPEFMKFQIGPYFRLPLWELVYHDSVVSQWYWGDASNKAPEVWDDRDLWNLLYGTAPLVMFDKTKWAKEKDRILQTYRNVCENVRKIGYDGMLSHEFLTEDHTVQRTKWSSGATIVVNFGSEPYRYTAGKSIPPKGFFFSGK